VAVPRIACQALASGTVEEPVRLLRSSDLTSRNTRQEGVYNGSPSSSGGMNSHQAQHGMRDHEQDQDRDPRTGGAASARASNGDRAMSPRLIGLRCSSGIRPRIRYPISQESG
jgi:hypothetical protein